MAQQQVLEIIGLSKSIFSILWQKKHIFELDMQLLSTQFYFVFAGLAWGRMID
jgi:hypothetical protein